MLVSASAPRASSRQIRAVCTGGDGTARLLWCHHLLAPFTPTPLPSSCRRDKKAVAAAPPITRYATGQRFIVIDTPTSRVYCRRLPEPWAPWERIAKREAVDAVVFTLSTKPLLDALRSIPDDFVSLSSDGGDSGLNLGYTTPTGRGRLVVDGAVPRLPPIRHRVRYLVDALACCGVETTMAVSASAATRIGSGRFVAFIMYAVGG